MKTVKPDSTLLLFFKMELEDGTEVESNFNDDAIEFQMGDGSLTTGMEDALLDKSVGETVSVLLSPDMAFGMPDENNIHSLPKADFPDDMPPELHQVIAFDSPDDSEILGTIVAIHQDDVDVDFSHPLSGRTIHFTANIKDIL